MKSLKLIYSSAVGATVSVWLVVALTVAGELSVPFKAFLKGLSGHHWITKGVVTFLAYLLVAVIIYYVSRPDKGNLHKSLLWLINSIIIGTVVLFLFFSAHFFGFV